jgi:hypothetical protein
MDPAVILFILRLVSAALLLSFFGIIAWLIYKDVRLSTNFMSEFQRAHGTLMIVATEVESLAVGSRYPLMPVTSIGRAPENSVVLDDDYVSSEHTLISLRDGRWWLEDLGSRNGTLLNLLLLQTATVLTAGDVVTIGRTRLRLEI